MRLLLMLKPSLALDIVIISSFLVSTGHFCSLALSLVPILSSKSSKPSSSPSSSSLPSDSFQGTTSNCISTKTVATDVRITADSKRRKTNENRNDCWSRAKAKLRTPDCCVVSIDGLEEPLKILQRELADHGPSDIDLRARIRCSSTSIAYDDCERVLESVLLPSSSSSAAAADVKKRKNSKGDDCDLGSTFMYDHHTDDIDKAETFSMRKTDDSTNPCIDALVELACGVVSLADGPRLEGICTDVFVRIVCASDYQALDPMYHTDKAPFRGYATLRGVGTEFMTRPCSSPLEYVTLRSVGQPFPSTTPNPIRRAEELEFIVMKGDYYECNEDDDDEDFDENEDDGTFGGINDGASSEQENRGKRKKNALTVLTSRIRRMLWTRASACVHRSPPGSSSSSSTTAGDHGAYSRRRVIISFDVADGDDDREWYQVDTKRKWRCGMTQRKSHLVA